MFGFNGLTLNSVSSAAQNEWFGDLIRVALLGTQVKLNVEDNIIWRHPIVFPTDETLQCQITNVHPPHNYFFVAVPYNKH